ncbi:hypothetical protein DPMN_118364 [Dreissena polymorpha]|uniref:Uncharacterized protein n=2 Tax=Dreissena polymorpha TaxID=45954 RepID=A0A9D4GGA1_DREPO|nr:hypothetical protein DPMN_118364 [Dreissena polymorpha]
MSQEDPSPGASDMIRKCHRKIHLRAHQACSGNVTGRSISGRIRHDSEMSQGDPPPGASGMIRKCYREIHLRVHQA